ncbi:histidine kinase N-terminal 7TM domain-containing protein [Halorientalis pallida]|uniref:histidine kinase N-terminal 7TM domain-containing protein n=1 Tax=Halorientalis pallida TaxID=2479928 RepID=UPI003C6EAB6A
MFQYSIYVPALLLVAGISTVAAYLGYAKRGRRGTIWYVGVMAAITAWSLSLALTVASTSYQLKLVFFAGFLVSSVALCSCWFLFAAAYTGHYDKLPRYLPHALLVVPFVYVPATLTDAARDLVIVNPRLVTEGGTVLLTYDAWGPVAWGFILFTYTLLVAATVLLFRKALHSRNVYRKLSLVLGFGGLSMWTTNMITVAGFSPFPHMMLVPFSFLFWGAVALVLFTSIRFVQMIPINAILARFSSRFDDVLPLARDFVIEEIDSGVMILDADGRIVDINSTARKMLGLEDRVVGKPVFDMVELEKYWDDYVEGELLSERRDQIWVQGDDEERCYDINISDIEDKNGNFAGQSVLLYDVTEQKEREEQLREREEELRQQKQDLEQQKQQLEHQNERLDRFASIVSHDLRNPLNVATGHVELLEARLDGEHRESVEELDTAHERMRDIIDDALTLARSGKAITETEDVDVGSVATEAWENVDTDRASLDHDLDLRLESDRDRLLNVFENLYRNALDHNDGDLTIRVGTLPDDTGFYVEDTGDGIPEDERDEVLEQGYTTHEEGTGLGLAIVRDIVGAHGWELSIAESPEGGARFEIECFREPVEVRTAAA